MNRRPVWILAGCAAIMLCADLWMPSIDPFRSGAASEVGFIFGTCFGQIMLCALWVALRTHRFIQRLFEVHLLIAMLLIGLNGSVLRTDSAEELFLVLLINSALYLYFLIVFAALWMVRIGCGYQLVGQADQESDAPSKNQFEMKHLFIWTAAIAVVLGFARVSLPALSVRSIIIISWEPVIIFLCLVACSAMVGIPISLAILREPLRFSWLICSILLAVLVAMLQRPAIALIPNAQVQPADQWIFWYMNAFQAAWIYGLLSLVRASGLRLKRRRIKQSP